MFDFISKLTFSKGVYISFLILGNLIAPYWYLYQFFPQMVTGNSVFQQVIFSLAISIPITCIFLIVQVWMGYKVKEINIIKKNEGIGTDMGDSAFHKLLFKYIALSSLSVAFDFYALCILSYLSPLVKENIIPLSVFMFCIQLLGGILIVGLFTNIKKNPPKK